MSFLVVVTGSRYWHYAMPIIEELQALPDGTILMHGGANGADNMAAAVAKIMCPNIIDIVPVLADWKKYGRGAGPLRNQRMIDAQPDFVLAFHNDLEGSKGTRDMVERCKKNGIYFKHISVGPADHSVAARRWSGGDGHEFYSGNLAGRVYGQDDYGAMQMLKA